jgi:hypothetical protein
MQPPLDVPSAPPRSSPPETLPPTAPRWSENVPTSPSGTNAGMPAASSAPLASDASKLVGNDAIVTSGSSLFMPFLMANP